MHYHHTQAGVFDRAVSAAVAAAPSVDSAFTSADGTTATIHFDRPLAAHAAPTTIVLKKNGVSVAYTANAIAGLATSVVLTPSVAFVYTDVLTVSYAAGPGEITAYEGGLEAAFTNQAVTNNVAPPAPVADFTADNTSPDATQRVNFTYTGTSPGTTTYHWEWSYDGSTWYDFGTPPGPTVQNPYEGWGNSGPRSIRVTATNAGGSHTATKIDYIQVYPVVTGVSPSSGGAAGGIEVTISGAGYYDGTGFPAVTAVAFGGSPAASFTVDNSSQLRATNPSGAGPVDVRVTAAGNQSRAVAADVFTYPTPPPPDFTLSPTSGSAPLTVNFAATNPPAGTAYYSYGRRYEPGSTWFPIDSTAGAGSADLGYAGTYSIRLEFYDSGFALLDTVTKTACVSVVGGSLSFDSGTYNPSPGPDPSGATVYTVDGDFQANASVRLEQPTGTVVGEQFLDFAGSLSQQVYFTYATGDGRLVALVDGVEVASRPVSVA